MKAKHFISFLLTAIMYIGVSCAQEHTSLIDIKPEKEYENIHVKKLSDDSLSSCFIIWVKKSVKAHRHISHTETVYVIEGEGTMTLGEKEFIIKPGDFISIPKNTAHSVKVTSNIPIKVLSVQAPIFDGTDRVFE